MNQTTTLASIIQRVMFTIMLASPAISQAQTAIIDAGKLAGFDDIMVGGNKYNVRYVDETFNDIFVDASGLDFTTSASAKEAAQALVDAYSTLPIYT